MQTELDEGIGATFILNEGMIAAMAEVRSLFQEGEYFVPEMLIATRAMQAGLGDQVKIMVGGVPVTAEYAE